MMPNAWVRLSSSAGVGGGSAGSAAWMYLKRPLVISTPSMEMRQF